MTTLHPADPCAPSIHLPLPTAKTAREVRLENLMREMLPFVSTSPQPTEKTIDLIERVTKEIK